MKSGIVESKPAIPNSILLVLSALVPFEETELAGDLEDLALVLDHTVGPHRSLLGTAFLSDRTACSVRTPALLRILFRGRCGLLHRGGRLGLFLCGGRGRCFSSCGPDLESRVGTQALLEDRAQLL